jgi:starch synthase
MQRATSEDSVVFRRGRIIHVCRECAGIVQSGGVGDVVRQLAEQCARAGLHTSIVVPRYGCVTLPVATALFTAEIRMDYPNCRRSEKVEFFQVSALSGLTSLELWLIDSPRFRAKHHPYVYTKDEARAFKEGIGLEVFCGAEPPPPDYADELAGRGHYDYFAMNALLQKAVLELIEWMGPNEYVVHCHDAHVAALPMLLRHSKEYGHAIR